MEITKIYASIFKVAILLQEMYLKNTSNRCAKMNIGQECSPQFFLIVKNWKEPTVRD